MRALQVAANTVSLAKFALPLMQALRAEGWEVDALGGPDGHEGELERAGFPVHPWPMGHSLNPLVIDRVMITNDNPRGEEQKQIVDDILQGLSCPWAAEMEYDRSMCGARTCAW